LEIYVCDEKEFEESVIEWCRVACKLILHGIGTIITLFSLEGSCMSCMVMHR